MYIVQPLVITICTLMLFYTHQDNFVVSVKVAMP